MSSNAIIPIILCGGTGSRLWPLSRKSFPKQYLSLNSKKLTLLQETQLRIQGLKNLMNPIIICNEEHRFIAAENMREININPLTILLEPFGKNTGPAITIAALTALEKEKDPSILVLSSDHKINNKKIFQEAINYGLSYANNSHIITFGIIPTFPSTGYGYIRSNKISNTNKLEGGKILEFIEKPNLENAKIFIKDKSFTWNSGIFLFKAKTFLSEVEKFSPDLLRYCKESLNKSKYDFDFRRIDKDSFAECPNISVDVAIMEKTNKGIVIPMDPGWSDVGSWKSLWEISTKDLNNNYIQGNIIAKNTKGCYIRSEKRLIVTEGIENLVVIETNDAILIIDKESTQYVKNIVADLENRKISEGINHKKVFRPWGNYESIIEDKNWQVKLIRVKAKHELSLQMHNHRSEHWIVLKGTAKVEINDEISILEENQSTYIPKFAKHRLTNPRENDLLIIEVQLGSYLGEDDIIRFEDNYGRAINKID